MSLTAKYSVVQLILSFLGAGIAGTVYYAHQHSIDLPCSVGGSCALVESSHWSMLFGIPVAMLGAAAYAVLAVLAVVKLNSNQQSLEIAARWTMLLISGAGFLFSWYLQYVAAVFIGAFCIYCRSSAIDMTVLFFVGIAEIVAVSRTNKRENLAVGS